MLWRSHAQTQLGTCTDCPDADKSLETSAKGVLTRNLRGYEDFAGLSFDRRKLSVPWLVLLSSLAKCKKDVSTFVAVDFCTTMRAGVLWMEISKHQQG